MRDICYKVRSRPVIIHVIERAEDLPKFVEWVKRHQILAFDTETTGLDIYSPGFKVRLAQFGTSDEAYVVPVELGDEFVWHVTSALRFVPKLICHNASFDIQVAAKHLGHDIAELFAKTIDTAILSRLWDSRAFKDGGPGHKLEELTAALVSRQVAEEVKASIGRMAKELRIPKEEFFRTVPISHEGYNLYAGMDVILTSLLYEQIPGMIPFSARHLIPYEHDIARVCSLVERKGFLVDVEYTNALTERLRREETWYQILIEEFTDDYEFSTNSTDEVARVLLDSGWDAFEFTPSGRLKVDDALLNAAADEGIEFAEWVRQAKKAKKWRKTWPEGFLSRMDADCRAHAAIHTMQARTARMSISGIPAQTLPSNDSLIRNCFIADPGHVICSIDYMAQELRVTAALSKDAAMLRAFNEDLDLHQMTADAAGVSRSIGKMTNFLTVYGGTWKALMTQAHIDEVTAKRVLKAFAEQYPGVAKLADEVTKKARRQGYVETMFGRRLYVDRDRAYSAMNYVIQSTSRDITASALLRLDKAGFTPYVKLPIHDEILFSFPEDQAHYGARTAGAIMLHTINGLDVPTDPEVGGRAWGSLYEKAA
ncbi:DNA polymerase [Actinomadura rubrisoli]|uniref:DNA polymerase I n=1 Tax=Actinomadura rubrisoli TaxID=2530368 RepID=A0A4R5CE75_9ACTN|nr:DNA polymerase [Actinomadura rubrisoli]TDD97216.1 DNA polymerase [Actinomadura rubrisoli]